MKKLINDRRGFTLIELMIAIVIVGIISVVIYQLFNTTSQNFREVDQLSDVNNRLRFATEVVRNHLQAAGNQGTPDSDLDSWVQPKPAGSARIAGIIPYAGWQSATNTPPLPVDVAAVNPEVRFDGLVVVGAFDLPLSFELAGLAPPSPRQGRIFNNQRGTMKLFGQDLFVSGVPDATPLTNQLRDRLAVGGAGANWTARLLRVSDRQGYQQFMQPGDLQVVGGPDPADHYFTVDLLADGTLFGPKFKGAGSNGFYGLDDLLEGDTGYDAALLDVVWFHVVPDQSNPNIMTLVRERLCGATVMQSGFAGFDPNAARASTCPGGVDESVVLATGVADFQVWFDCADTTDGALRGSEWDFGWQPNDHSSGTDCLNTGAPEPGLVRGGHIRLAMHTLTERADQAHVQFEDAVGAVCPGGACDPLRVPAATLRTYDFLPDTAGAARVVVMQTDFEMVNFVNRNPLP